MFNLKQFIAEHVICRSTSMFATDIEANKESLQAEIENKSVCVIGGAGSIGASFIRAKLLQKSEMRKNMVMDLIYRGFINAANYSESHYNPRRSQIKTELRYLFVTTPNR